MEPLIAVVVLAVVVAVAAVISDRSRRNPDPLFEHEDPETGISEQEWSDAIK